MQHLVQKAMCVIDTGEENMKFKFCKQYIL